MSLQAVITAFATGTYAVTRRGAGAYVNGYFVAAGSSQFNITASVQPVTGRELRALPEAYHSEVVKVLYTTTELFTRTPTQSPDVVAIDSEDYEVFKVETWEAFGGTHYVVYAALVLTQPDQEFVMQSGQEQSFQFTTPSSADEYAVTIPIAMTDTTYVVEATISTVPTGGALAMLVAKNAGRTTTQFTLSCSGKLAAGTVIDIVVRDRT